MTASRRARTIGLAVGLAILTSGCSSMKPSDFKDAEPRLEIESYFAGQTRAWGFFEDRFGTVRRQFTVDIDGTQDGDELVLDERFTYSDGETDRRVWRIRRTGEHEYEGRAGDVVGVARGTAYGNALNWRYHMDLKVGDGTLRVHFDDWMFLQPSGVLLNRAEVTKFGVAIGRVTLSFAKPDSAASALSVPPAAVEAMRAVAR